MPEIDRKSARKGSKLQTSISQTTDSGKTQVVQIDEREATAVRTVHQNGVDNSSLQTVQDGSEHTEQSLHTTRDKIREVGGRDGPDPVRYGDWEKGGRCIDF